MAPGSDTGNCAATAVADSGRSVWRGRSAAAGVAASVALALAVAIGSGAGVAGAAVVGSVPAPTLVAVPVSPLNSSSATIEFTGLAGSTFDCSIDGRPFAPCVSPLELTGLLDGTHTVVVRQVDAAGDISEEVSVVAWESDTIAPRLPTVSSNRSGSVNVGTATVTIAGDGESAFVCSVDSGAYEDCDSPLELSGLADGAHTVAVKQEDAAGNRSPARTVGWTVDTVAPAAPTVSSNRTGFTAATSALVSFSGESGGSFQCKVDSGSWSACGASPKSVTGLADGEHTVSVRQVDAATNVSAAAFASWTVDTVSPSAPTLSIDRSGTTNRTNVTATFSGESGATFRCSIDSGAYAACSSPTSWSGLAAGVHRVRVVQLDQAGNASSPANRDWTVATLTASKAPALSAGNGTIVSIGTSITGSGQAFSGSSGLATLAYKWQRCSSPTSCTDIPGASAATRQVTVDDVGYALRFAAVHTSTDGATATAFSARSGVVVPTATSVPAIALPSGASGPAYGRPLSASGPTWLGLLPGTTLAYRWQRCFSDTTSSCLTIAGATSATYTPSVTDLGRRLRLTVSAPAGGQARSVSAPLSAKVAVRAVNSVAPTLNLGTVVTAPTVGTTLSVRKGTWLYTWEGSYSYRWDLCPSASESSCYAISEQRSTLVPRTGFVGKRLRARVTYSGRGGVAVTAFTPVSAPVLP